MGHEFVTRTPQQLADALRAFAHSQQILIQLIIQCSKLLSTNTDESLRVHELERAQDPQLQVPGRFALSRACHRICAIVRLIRGRRRKRCDHVHAR